MTWDYNLAQLLLLLFAGIGILFLPGYVILRLFLWKNQDIGQTMALSLGLSISSISLLAQILFFLPWEPPDYSFLIAIIVVTILSLGFALSNIFRQRTGSASTGFILGVMTAIAWRIFQVRAMVFPAGVNSPDHVLITRKILEIGRIPENLQPYLPVSFHSYFTFEVLCACFSRLSGCSPVSAVFLVGQVLNAVIALSMYRLAMVVLEERRYAIIAAALTLFVTPLPAAYSVWGDYALLTGMVLLPLGMAEVQAWHQRRDRSSLGRLLLLVGGTVLAHLFVGVLLILFLGIGLILEGWPGPRKRTGLLPDWVLTIASPVFGILLAAPWFLQVGTFINGWVRIHASSWSNAFGQFFSPHWNSSLPLFAGPWQIYPLGLFALAGLAAAWTDTKTRLLAIWTAFLLLAAIPWGLFEGPFRPEHFLLACFIPTALFIAALFRYGQTALSLWQGERSVNRIASAILLLVIFAGILQSHSIRDPEAILAEKEDRLALRWLDENVSRQARFLAYVTPGEWGTYCGSDGGAWILPLTGRWSAVPSPLYAMGNIEYVAHTNEVAKRISLLNGCDDSLRQLLQQEQITHMYLGAKTAESKTTAMDNCPILEELYRRGPVRIFQVKS